MAYLHTVGQQLPQRHLHHTQLTNKLCMYQLGHIQFMKPTETGISFTFTCAIYEKQQCFVGCYDSGSSIKPDSHTVNKNKAHRCSKCVTHSKCLMMPSNNHISEPLAKTQPKSKFAAMFLSKMISQFHEAVFRFTE